MSENNNTNCEFVGYRVETIFCGQCRYHTLLLKGGKREAFILEEGITSDKGNNNREKWAQVLSEIYAEGKKEGENNWHAGAERERKRRYDEAIAMEKELEKREKRGEECLDEPCEQAQKWANRGVMTDMLARREELEKLKAENAVLKEALSKLYPPKQEDVKMPQSKWSVETVYLGYDSNNKPADKEKKQKIIEKLTSDRLTAEDYLRWTGTLKIDNPEAKKENDDE